MITVIVHLTMYYTQVRGQPFAKLTSVTSRKVKTILSRVCTSLEKRFRIIPCVFYSKNLSLV
jgi:hypothetical protein